MAMRARLVLLVLVAIAVATVRADGPPRRPDDRVRMERENGAPLPPNPIGNVQPDQSALFVGGEYCSGGPCGCRYESGWRFPDGSLVRGSLGGAPGTFSATYQRPLWETEFTRCSAVVGTECGVCKEWYLGHGFAVRHEFLVPRPLLRSCIVWYPAEGVQLRFGLDLLQRRRFWGWEWSF
jgi:hypothetical protein